MFRFFFNMYRFIPFFVNPIFKRMFSNYFQDNLLLLVNLRIFFCSQFEIFLNVYTYLVLRQKWQENEIIFSYLLFIELK